MNEFLRTPHALFIHPSSAYQILYSHHTLGFVASSLSQKNCLPSTIAASAFSNVAYALSTPSSSGPSSTPSASASAFVSKPRHSTRLSSSRPIWLSSLSMTVSVAPTHEPRPIRINAMPPSLLTSSTASKGRNDEEKRNTEYEEFSRDLEENPEIRFNVSLYCNKEYLPSDVASTADVNDVPSIPLEELLVDLDLSEDERNQNGENIDE